MVCLLAELLMEKSIRELLVDNLPITEKGVKLIDAVLSLTELVTLCYTHYSVELSVMIVFSLLNTSQWT